MDVRGSKPEADISVKLPCGLTVRFRQGVKPEGNLLVEPVQRAIRNTCNFENVVNDAREAGRFFGPLVIVNHMGSWINMAAHAAQMGLREIDVWQSPRTNETLTDTRRYLYAPNEKIVAIPNYKCGYSSLKMVFSQVWGNESQKDKRQINLDGIMSMSELPSEFVFSIVRDPIERFVSFYVDKFMRPPTHTNYVAWRMPHEVLLGKNFGPDAMLWLIENTPKAFADLHWKPFASNLFHEGRALAHRVYDIDAAASLSRDLSELLKRKISLPHVNVTDHIDHKDVMAKTLQSKDRLERAYAADFEFLAKLRAMGGVADPSDIGLPGEPPSSPLQTVA